MSIFRASNTPGTDWSVPVQRGPYPPGHLDQDGSTERLYTPADAYALPDEPEPLAEPGFDDPGGDARDYDGSGIDQPERRRGAASAVAIALIALLASGGASLMAWHA